MLQAYGALDQAAAAEALDAKTRELIAIAVANYHTLRKLHQRARSRRCQSRCNRKRNRRSIGHCYRSECRCRLYLRFARFGSSRNPTLIGCKIRPLKSQLPFADGLMNAN